MTDVAKKRRLTSSKKGHEMNDGVALLLERMKTNPEEFLTEGLRIGSKWGGLIAEYSESLDPEDADVLKESLKKIKQQKFTELVMEELIDPKKSKWETVGMVTSNTPLATPIPALSSITMTPSLRETIATLEEIKKEYEPKQHKTLFGRLFNYS